MIGNRLGQYEIEVSLGAGGMGEVYQAKDTRLGRSVAVKVLPEALAKIRNGLRDSNVKPKFWPRSIMPTSRHSTDSSKTVKHTF